MIEKLNEHHKPPMICVQKPNRWETNVFGYVTLGNWVLWGIIAYVSGIVAYVA